MAPGHASLEHFARIVSPIRWRDVLIQMLTVCFDASGKTPSISTSTKKRRRRKVAPDSQVMAVAGFASQVGAWGDFDEQWGAVLKRYSVPHFHAADLAYCRNEYRRGWSGEQQKKDDFQSELMEVIENCGLRKFGSVLWVSDQDKARAQAGLSTDATASPFVLCARSAVEDFIAYAIGENQRENIEYVFEKGDEEDKLRKHFRKHSFQEPLFRWKHPVELKGIIQKPFIGLQAAGWLVWEYFMSFDRVFNPGRTLTAFDRKTFRIFNDHRRIPGEIKILYKSAPLLHFMRNFVGSYPELFGKVTEVTARLEAATREGVD